MQERTRRIVAARHRLRWGVDPNSPVAMGTKDRKPVFGPTKNGDSRKVDLGTQVLALLRAHKRQHSELKMSNRARYQGHGPCARVNMPTSASQKSSGYLSMWITTASASFTD